MINRLLRRFDDWTKLPLLTPEDLGIYRIIWGVAALFLAQNVTSASDLPTSMWSPPLGPMLLITDQPAPAVLWALFAAQFVAITLVTIGYKTKWSSLAAGSVIIVNDGIRYSDGKIDHASALFALVPIVLAYADWGSAFGIDAAKRNSRERASKQSPAVVRYLAILCGTALATAALYKIPTWTDLDSRAALAHAYGNTAWDGRQPFISIDSITQFVGTSRWIWETLDWLTILIEAGLIIAALNWKSYRLWLALLCVFHFSIDATFGIIYAANPVVYAAFVPWASWLRRPLNYLRLDSHIPRILLVAATAASIFTLWVAAPNDWRVVQDFIGHAIILVAACIGTGYLLLRARAIFLHSCSILRRGPTGHETN